MRCLVSLPIMRLVEKQPPCHALTQHATLFLEGCSMLLLLRYSPREGGA